MFRSLFAAAVLLAAAACATPVASGSAAPAQPQVAAGDAATGDAAPAPRKKKKSEEWICYYEKTVGSNIPEQICRPKALADLERERTQDNLRLNPILNEKVGH